MNFFSTFWNIMKLIPILVVYESFEYFNNFYYFQQKGSSVLFSNLLKVLFTISAIIISGEWFDSGERHSSLGFIHFTSLFSMIFMFFDLAYDAAFINWLLILFLSISYISIPIIISSWIRYYYKDDLIISFSLYGAFYGIVKIIVSYIMAKSTDGGEFRLVVGIGSMLIISGLMYYLGWYKSKK